LKLQQLNNQNTNWFFIFAYNNLLLKKYLFIYKKCIKYVILINFHLLIKIN
jgi:hypothetical protein